MPAKLSAPEIRLLRRADAPLFSDHLRRLDADSRFERFGMTKSDHAVSEYAARCFANGDPIFGFFVDGVLRAAGELHGRGQKSVEEAAEAAFSVERQWRGQGVGAALLDSIVEAARDIGARTLDLTCLPHNRPMQRLVQKQELRAAPPLADLDFVAANLLSPRADRVAPPAWRETFDADGFRATLDLAPRPPSPGLARKVA